MIKHLVIILSLIVSCIADEVKLDKLTVDGKTYSNVTVIKKNPDGISIMHDAGTARINYKKLPKSVVQMVGEFDEEEAKKYTENEKVAQRKFDKLVDNYLKTNTSKEKETPISRLEILYSRERYLISELNRRIERLGKLGQNRSEAQKSEIQLKESIKAELKKVQNEILTLQQTQPND